MRRKSLCTRCLEFITEIIKACAIIATAVRAAVLLVRRRGLIIIKQLTTVDCHYRRGCASARTLARASSDPTYLLPEIILLSTGGAPYSPMCVPFACVRVCLRRSIRVLERKRRGDDAALERLRFLHYDNYIRANLVEIAPVGC